ncbi:hypothetical protein AAFF_G00126550 [Aldrovandia affinis]|uniref:C2H2-type domain-containing protein n=1 Tax=Aldrovandia affinis TaxID=143900 RepID=A0AAD7RR80_9TELE|nr:hypothetical protein AAFF_G00126550 [Aldrovandia affinis]
MNSTDMQKCEEGMRLPVSGSNKYIFDEMVKRRPRTIPTCTVTSYPTLCFSCKGAFSDRVSLEEHACTNVNYICSCGILFLQYSEMKAHELTHGDGDLSRILPNMKTRQEEPEKVWRTLDLFVHTKLIKLPRAAVPVTKQIKGITASPTLNMSSLEPKCPRGATIDLRRRFLPVVCVESHQKFVRGKKFKCAVCQLTFHKQHHLVEHHHSHIQEGVYGCLRCGLLLVTHASLPSHHQCGTFFATPKSRYTIGKVLPRKLPEQQGKTFFRCRRCPVAYLREAQLRKHEMSCIFGKDRIVNGLGEKEMVRCSRCQVYFSSFKMLQVHRCSRRPGWVHGQATVNRTHNQTQVHKEVREWINPYFMPQRHQEEEVTFRFHTSRNLKKYTHQPADNGVTHGIIREPFQLKGLEVSPVLKPVAVDKDVVEIDDDCYVVESTSTKANRPSL